MMQLLEFHDKFGVYEQQYLDGIINVPNKYKLSPHKYFDILVAQDRLEYQRNKLEYSFDNSPHTMI